MLYQRKDACIDDSKLAFKFQKQKTIWPRLKQIDLRFDLTGATYTSKCEYHQRHRPFYSCLSSDQAFEWQWGHAFCCVNQVVFMLTRLHLRETSRKVGINWMTVRSLLLLSKSSCFYANCSLHLSEKSRKVCTNSRSPDQPWTGNSAHNCEIAYWNKTCVGMHTCITSTKWCHEENSCKPLRLSQTSYQDFFEGYIPGTRWSGSCMEVG